MWELIETYLVVSRLHDSELENLSTQNGKVPRSQVTANLHIPFGFLEGRIVDHELWFSDSCHSHEPS